MLDEIPRIQADGDRQIRGAATLDELRAVESQVLGKRSELTALRQQVGGLDADARREAGKLLNEARAALEAAAAERRDELAAAERRVQLEAERLDLTEVLGAHVRGHLHPVSQAQQRLEDVFVGMGFTVAEGPEVESDWYNFEALNLPPAHPARSMWDTLYVDLGEEPGHVLLRTHTSPVQVRVMQQQEPPIYIVAPGRVYRRDTADATHMPVFHQIEGLVIDKGITFGDLAGTLEAFTTAFFGAESQTRLRPSYFPFTEPSAEYDVYTPAFGWLELGGCGMVHPAVLQNVGIDPEEWSGFAFGFGIDRFTLLFNGVDDLRDLWSNDVRFLHQF
jgi:phenylalanyl-tRNA synthetase alpha chain